MRFYTKFLNNIIRQEKVYIALIQSIDPEKREKVSLRASFRLRIATIVKTVGAVRDIRSRASCESHQKVQRTQ